MIWQSKSNQSEQDLPLSWGQKTWDDQRVKERVAMED